MYAKRATACLATGGKTYWLIHGLLDPWKVRCASNQLDCTWSHTIWLQMHSHLSLPCISAWTCRIELGNWKCRDAHSSRVCKIYRATRYWCSLLDVRYGSRYDCDHATRWTVQSRVVMHRILVWEEYKAATSGKVCSARYAMFKDDYIASFGKSIAFLHFPALRLGRTFWISRILVILSLTAPIKMHYQPSQTISHMLCPASWGRRRALNFHDASSKLKFPKHCHFLMFSPKP